MNCQVCDCELSSDEIDAAVPIDSEGYTCFDCIVLVSKGIDDAETGKLVIWNRFLGFDAERYAHE